MNKIEYKSSSKKIIYACAFCFLLLLALIILSNLKLNGDMRLMFIIASSISTGILCLYLIKAAKNALCPRCNVDLYNVIDAAHLKKIKINYCPSCGVDIEI